MMVLPITTIIMSYKNNIESGEIAKKYNCSKSTILRLLKKNNIEIRKGRIGRLDIKEKEIIVFYKKCRSAEKVAKKYKCSPSLVYRILKNNNIKRNKYKIILNKNKVKEFYKKCRSAGETSNKFNCNISVILRILREDGVKLDKYKKMTINLDYNKVIELYKEHKSAYRITKILGCSKNPIYRILKINNIKILKSEPKNRLNLDEKEVVKIYKKLKTLIKTTKYFGCGEGTIRKILRKNNIKTDIKLDLDVEEIKELYKKHKNGTIVADILNCNFNIIYNRLKKGGVKLMTTKERWSNEKYAKKRTKAILKGLFQSPTSYEKRISELCIENNLPFIYTGNGTFMIGRKNPDFKHKSLPIVIEVFNNYHKIKMYGSVENYIEQRGNYFRDRGYDTIFIRQEEITDENWEVVCLNKIRNDYNE